MANGSMKYIDPFNESIISYDGKKFGIDTNKKSYVGSRVAYSDIILHSFKIESSASDEEIANSAEIKMYEEAGLDLDKKYKITFVKKELEFEEAYLIEAIALEEARIQERLESVLEKTSFIDYLAIPFLTFKTLYTNKIIAPQNDIFIYLGLHGSFLAIYSDGKYLSTKSLLSIEEMTKKLANAGVDMTPETLKKHLTEKGVDASAYERGETVLYNELENIFSEIFTKVNDVVLYNRSVFGFEKIDRIFLSMQTGRIKGLKDFIQSFGFTDVKLHDFNLFKEKVEDDFFSHIVTSYILDELEDDNHKQNVTIFKRKAPLYKREVGKILLTATILISLLVGSIGYLYLCVFTLEAEQNSLQDRYNKVLKNYKRYNNKVGALNSKLASVSKEKRKYSERFSNIKKSVQSVENILKEQRDYVKFLEEVTLLLKKYSLSTTRIEQLGNDSMSIDIIAFDKQRDNIAKFMEDLLKDGYVSTNTSEIRSDKEIYLSTIEIKR